jgi:hypothetical protein
VSFNSLYGSLGNRPLTFHLLALLHFALDEEKGIGFAVSTHLSFYEIGVEDTASYYFDFSIDLLQ